MYATYVLFFLDYVLAPESVNEMPQNKSNRLVFFIFPNIIFLLKYFQGSYENFKAKYMLQCINIKKLNTNFFFF